MRQSSLSELGKDPLREDGEDHVVGVVADREHLASVATSGVDSGSDSRYRMEKTMLRICTLN